MTGLEVAGLKLCAPFPINGLVLVVRPDGPCNLNGGSCPRPRPGRWPRPRCASVADADTWCGRPRAVPDCWTGRCSAGLFCVSQSHRPDQEMLACPASEAMAGEIVAASVVAS